MNNRSFRMTFLMYFLYKHFYIIFFNFIFVITMIDIMDTTSFGGGASSSTSQAPGGEPWQCQLCKYSIHNRKNFEYIYIHTYLIKI